jgi:hypothetical protein
VRRESRDPARVRCRPVFVGDDRNAVLAGDRHEAALMRQPVGKPGPSLLFAQSEVAPSASLPCDKPVVVGADEHDDGAVTNGRVDD